MTPDGDPYTASLAYDTEFRASVDDAWYTVRLVLDDDTHTLTVKFWEFIESCDERFIVGDFSTIEAVDEFASRFRPVSEQLQDRECSSVVEGTAVCASFAFKHDDVRFYDAVVEAVHCEEHAFLNGEEECLCTFVLLWKHGPNEGTLTSSRTANICLVQSDSKLDSSVASFAKMAKEKIKPASLTSGLVSGSDMSPYKGAKCDKENGGSSIKSKSSISQHGLQETKTVKQFDNEVRTTEERFDRHGRIDQDRDFGGKSFAINEIEETGSHSFILVENLEKDLSPSSIVEFIHKQTTISPQAYVFPSLLSEQYTRGAIVLDCRKKLKKINEFLNNPDHVIMSLRGRPWVVTENVLRRGTFRTILESLMPKSQYKFGNRNIDNEIKVVPSGTEEYMTAKSLRDLFVDFVDHQKCLHKRLALEQMKILKSSQQVR